jgi:thiamine pyrophosphokinase
MRAVIFVNGILPNPQALRHWVREGDDLIAADGGAHHAIAMGLRPRVVVGDLDSLAPELAEQLAAQGVELEKYPVAKNQTDLELAIERAICDGAQEIILLGALGGRLDQSLANVLLLAQRDWSATIRLVDATQIGTEFITEIATVIHGGETMTLEATIGSTVSLLPLSAEVTGITYTGLLYTLNKARIALGSTRAVSNEVTSFPATVAIETGIALVIQAVGGG